MSNIKIEAITPIHIGSGETLQYETDFISVKTADGNDVLSIIDPRKVLDLIGIANVQLWVNNIEQKGSTSQLIKRLSPNSQLEDYSKRIITKWCTSKSADTLKEQIHDGQGRPYIPGSSIKGAIRTAILTSMANKIQNKENKIDKTKKDLKNNYNQKLKADAKQIESELFGSNPHKDIFRFLQVGDAYFEKTQNVAIQMVNINERERQGFWDTSKSQLIEAISPKNAATCQMKLNLTGYKFSKENVHGLPDCMNSISCLFKTINTHTQTLLKKEIDYWEERLNLDDSDTVSIYINKVKDILSATKECEEGRDCVLRIGYGSGWRFITGAWTEELDNFYTLVVPVSRPQNYKYENYNFPKTRRVDDGCELVGFVKLSVTEL